jgi:hypothetical protein
MHQTSDELLVCGYILVSMIGGFVVVVPLADLHRSAPTSHCVSA